MLRNSPTALRFLKASLNAAEDGQAGIQMLGGDATLLFYQTAEGNEVVFWCCFVLNMMTTTCLHQGRQAYLDKRAPDFSKFPRFP